MSRRRAPNRIFDPAELNDFPYKDVIGKLEELAHRSSGFYLHPSKRWEYPWALERAALSPGARVLDVGCGASIFPLFLAQCGFNVVATDVSPPAASETSRQLTVEYLKSEITNLPFSDDSVDTVFCISVIEHLPRENVEAALGELHRILKSRGKLLLTTDFFHSTETEIWYSGPGEPFRVDWHVFDENRLCESILNAPGFEVIGETDFTVDWDNLPSKMIRFHGYPYTAVGVALCKTETPGEAVRG